MPAATSTPRWRSGARASDDVAVRRAGAPRRSGRRAIVAATAAAASLVAGCATGQIAETAEIVPAVAGSSGTIGNIALRDVGVAPPPKQHYARGESARLTFTVVNSGTEADTLVRVSAALASSVTVGGGSIALPPGASVRVGSGGAVVTLTGLRKELRSGESFDMTFAFRDAGATTISVPVDAPLSRR
ncbi:MAG: copper chaperone PCu(A)C [Mycobacteriales bacterium]